MGKDAVEGNIIQELRGIKRRLAALERQEQQVGQLSELSGDLGDVTFGNEAGRLYPDGIYLNENTETSFALPKAYKFVDSGGTVIGAVYQQQSADTTADRELILMVEDTSGNETRAILKTINDTFNVTALAILGGEIIGGIWTPYVINTTNISTSTAYEGQYIRVGNVVHCSMAISITPTAAGACELRIDPPVVPSSNFADAYAGSGVGAVYAISLSGAVNSVPATKKLQLRFLAPATTAREWRLTFSYKLG